MNTGSTYVILLNYNGYDDTVECVASLKDMGKIENGKIVVVDNCSTDNSYEQLMECFSADPQVMVLQSGSNNGFSAGNNIGIRYALAENADFIWLLNNDTIVAKDCLTQLLQFSRQHPRSLISGKIYEYDNPDVVTFYGGRISNRFYDGHHIAEGEQDSAMTMKPLQAEWLTGCCFFAPRSIFDQFLLDERYFLYHEDMDYSLTMSKHGIEMWVTPEAKLWHKGCASTKKINWVKNYYLHRNKLLLISQHAPVSIRLQFYVIDSIRSFFKIFRRAVKGYLFHNEEAKARALYEFRAVWDFWTGHFGKMQ